MVALPEFNDARAVIFLLGKGSGADRERWRKRERIIRATGVVAHPGGCAAADRRSRAASQKVGRIIDSRLYGQLTGRHLRDFAQRGISAAIAFKIPFSLPAILLRRRCRGDDRRLARMRKGRALIALGTCEHDAFLENGDRPTGLREDIHDRATDADRRYTRIDLISSLIGIPRRETEGAFDELQCRLFIIGRAGIDEFVESDGGVRPHREICAIGENEFGGAFLTGFHDLLAEDILAYVYRHRPRG